MWCGVRLGWGWIGVGLDRSVVGWELDGAKSVLKGGWCGRVWGVGTGGARRGGGGDSGVMVMVVVMVSMVLVV